MMSRPEIWSSYHCNNQVIPSDIITDEIQPEINW
jgi:hypothetical protein